jgi:hypothetical protein
MSHCLFSGLLASIPFAMLLVIGCEQPPAKQLAPSASAAPSATAAAAASVSAGPAASPPDGKSIKATLGSVVKIEVSGQKKMEITKQAEVDALLAAIGADQVPSGVRRRCPDIVVVTMKDASGTEKGNVGICDVTNLGPEFFTGAGNDRKGITLADEATVRKILKLEVPDAGANPSSSAAPKK